MVSLLVKRKVPTSPCAQPHPAILPVGRGTRTNWTSLCREYMLLMMRLSAEEATVQSTAYVIDRRPLSISNGWATNNKIEPLQASSLQATLRYPIRKILPHLVLVISGFTRRTMYSVQGRPCSRIDWYCTLQPAS